MFLFHAHIYHACVGLVGYNCKLLWDYTSGSFWQARGWELRMWLCEAIHCAQYVSITLFVRQLLCDMAFIGEYAEGNVLRVHMLPEKSPPL